MFTGLIEARGEVAVIEPEGSAVRIAVRPPADLYPQASLGESIAINGCCLTVVSREAGRWTFEAGAETLSKTNLGKLQIGEVVNLERALAADGRFGGHIVQGHVDAVATVDEISRDGEWVTMWFRFPTSMAAQIVPKGSVAVDGISLTVVDVDAERFSVALIPHTLDVTTLSQRDIGDTVNLETDILGKYVARLVALDSVSKDTVSGDASPQTGDRQ